MKRTLFVPLLLAVLLFLSGISAGEPMKTRVLVFYGGHPFNLDEFKSALFPETEQMDVSYALLPQERDRLAPGLEKDYDVLVMFDMDQQDPTEEQKEALKNLLEQGIGYFAFHHNICSLFNWDEYYDICGGKAMLDYAYPQGEKEACFRGKSYPFSTFVMGNAEFNVADSEHPIMQGVRNFQAYEELYGNILINPDVNVLLTSDSPNMTRTAAWTWRYGKSPVFATLLGHDASMWNNQDFHTMFINAVKWLAEEKRKVHGE